MTEEYIAEVIKRFSKANTALYEKIKDMHPYTNLEAKDSEGNYLIKEYGEYKIAYAAYSNLPMDEQL
jgi:uncharacterized protein involved in tolerance to divalent cations